MLIPYWMQRADLSSTDHEPVDAAQAVKDFLSYDWGAEGRPFDELDGRHEENCPAGFGFSADDGRRLHLCLDGEDRFAKNPSATACGRPRPPWSPSGFPNDAADSYSESWFSMGVMVQQIPPLYGAAARSSRRRANCRSNR